MAITLSESEIVELTSYRHATKQLGVLQQRGFLRAYINRRGAVVLERAHYEAVTKGELHTAVKRVNLAFLNPK
jgi:hypothetical protein